MVIERVEVGAIEGVRQLLLSDMDRWRSSEEACDCFARHTALLQVSLRWDMLSTQSVEETWPANWPVKVCGAGLTSRVNNRRACLGRRILGSLYNNDIHYYH